MRNSRRIERYEAKTNGDDPFSPFGASPMNRCFVAANATKQKLGNAMGDRFEFSLSRKETSTFFLPLSLRPFLSFSTSFPLPHRIFLHLCSLRACPVAFLFRGQILPLTFYDSGGRLGATIARETLLLAEHICRNNCYDYRAEISFMNLDFFYVSVLVYISVGKEFSIGTGTGFTGAEL